MGFLEAVCQFAPFDITKWMMKPSQKKAQRPDCFILNLPPDLILSISEALTPASRTILSQTCRPLCIILGKGPGAAKLSFDQQLEYLACHVRESPDEWLCEVCMTLHPVSEHDTPNTPEHIQCPIGWTTWRSLAYNSWYSNRFDYRHIRLNHHHAQLALKYTRMQHRHTSYQGYLQKLMAPYHNTNYNIHKIINKTLLGVQFSVFPKIVMGVDGNYRFLLLSIWRYHRNDNRRGLSVKDMGDLQICPHLQVYGFGRDPPCELSRAILELNNTQDENDDDGVIIEVNDVCSMCPTDFSLQAHAGYVDVRVWQDLGPEGSPWDPAWRVHTIPHKLRGYDDINYNLCRCYDLVVDHSRGDIRKLYNADSDGSVVLPSLNVFNRVR